MPNGKLVLARIFRTAAALAAALLFAAENTVADPAAPRALSRAEACRLTKQDATPQGRAYTIKGRYSWIFVDQLQDLQPDGCDGVFLTEIDGRAAAKIAAYLSAFSDHCGGNLGDFSDS